MSTPRLEVLYEDNHLLVVRKPPGALVQGDRTGDPTLLDAAKAYLKKKYRKPGEVYLGIVHRLDRPVGGVLVFARTSKAAARLAEQFRARRARKIYWAVVSGVPAPAEGTMEDWIGREESGSRLAAPDAPGARRARLRYRTLARVGADALVEIELETGRHHQIRVQFAARGHPILGDRRYGLVGDRRHGRADFDAPRNIALLARSLTVDHPTRGEPMTFVASPPAEGPWAGIDRAVFDLTTRHSSH